MAKTQRSHYYQGKKISLRRALLLGSARRSKAEQEADEIIRSASQRAVRQFDSHGRYYDFFFPRLGIAIEVDGQRHNAANDAMRDERDFRLKAYIVFHVKNHDHVALHDVLLRLEHFGTLDDRLLNRRRLRARDELLWFGNLPYPPVAMAEYLARSKVFSNIAEAAEHDLYSIEAMLEGYRASNLLRPRRERETYGLGKLKPPKM